jgi:hypothetical protein
MLDNSIGMAVTVQALILSLQPTCAAKRAPK